MSQKRPFQGGICPAPNIQETPPLIEEDSEDKEDLLTPGLDDLVQSKEPVPGSWEYLCKDEVPRPATPTNQPSPQPIPITPPCSPIKEYQSLHPHQPDQVEMLPDYELMELDIPDLLDIPKKVMSDFDVWAQDILSYQH